MSTRENSLEDFMHIYEVYPPHGMSVPLYAADDVVLEFTEECGPVFFVRSGAIGQLYPKGTRILAHEYIPD